MPIAVRGYEHFLVNINFRCISNTSLELRTSILVKICIYIFYYCLIQEDHVCKKFGSSLNLCFSFDIEDSLSFSVDKLRPCDYLDSIRWDVIVSNVDDAFDLLISNRCVTIFTFLV